MPRIKVYQDKYPDEPMLDFYFNYKEGFYKSDVEIPQEKFEAILKNANEWTQIQSYLKSLLAEQSK